MNDKYPARNTTILKNEGASQEAEEKMDDDLDDRVFALRNEASQGAIGGLGVIGEGKPASLWGVYYGWTAARDIYSLIYEMAAFFENVQFSTLEKVFPPGLVCEMQIQNPRLVRVSEDTKDFRKIQRSLLEIRANKPKTKIALYHDNARMWWAYKPIVPISVEENNSSYAKR